MAPADVPAMFFHSRRPASSAAATAPANAIPFTPPPSKTASALGGISTSLAAEDSRASPAVLTAQTYELRRVLSSRQPRPPSTPVDRVRPCQRALSPQAAAG